MSDEPRVFDLKTGAPVAQDGPRVDEELVSRLEAMLASARAGRLRSLAMAGGSEDEGAATSYYLGPGASLFTLAGAVSYLLHRINSELADSGQE